MSQCLNVLKLKREEARRLLSDLSFTIYNAAGKEKYFCFREVNNVLRVPLGYDTSKLSDECRITSGPHRKCKFTPVKLLLSGKDQLEQGVDPDKIKDQQEIFDEVKDMKTVALDLSTGIGKTVISTHLAAYHGEKAVVICGNLDILDQWEAEFIECGTTVAKITNPQSKAVPKADVLLCTVEVGRKLLPEQVADVGTVIYDEAHLSTITAVTETLLNFSPNHLIICSATIERLDGGHVGLALYHGGNVVKRVLKKSFELIRCDTGIVPDTSKKTYIGGRSRIDYSHSMSSVNQDPRFPIILVNLFRDILSTAKGRVLVLFRENCILYAVSKLLDDVDHFIANMQVKIKKELQDQQLILAIDKKAKEGVDIKGLSDIVMTYSSNSIVQPEGRVRDDDFRMWIIVHDHKMHENHWKKAEEWAETRSRGEYTTRTLSLAITKKK